MRRSQFGSRVARKLAKGSAIAKRGVPPRTKMSAFSQTRSVEPSCVRWALGANILLASAQFRGEAINRYPAVGSRHPLILQTTHLGRIGASSCELSEATET